MKKRYDVGPIFGNPRRRNVFKTLHRRAYVFQTLRRRAYFAPSQNVTTSMGFEKRYHVVGTKNVTPSRVFTESRFAKQRYAVARFSVVAPGVVGATTTRGTQPKTPRRRNVF